VTVSRDVRPLSVVVCDDVPEMRAIMSDVLSEDPNLTVVGEADNGKDVVRIVAQLRPDVVLLDLSMPDMDGLEAIPLIVKNSPHTGIIVFSGFGSNRMGDVAKELGADVYIEKGAGLTELSVAVHDVAQSRLGRGRDG
jgi:DNA-binding NarL/FixJ family response regulator